MPPRSSGPSLSPLRALTHSISTTPVKQLPSKITHLLAALEGSTRILKTPESHQSAKGSEHAVIVHKFKTQIRTLLQDASPQGRWTGVVLTKCAVEAGGWEVLRGCGSWARAILGIIGRPDPLATKALCIVTLTRIFLLTLEYPTLVREINTPTLPSYISSSLNLITTTPQSQNGVRQPKLSSTLLQPVLESFCLLLPNHPTLFRPFATQIHGLLILLVAPTPSTLRLASNNAGEDVSYDGSEEVLSAARELFTLLHFCAPKNTSGTEWMSALKTVVTEAHATADQLFRAVIEDWESTSGESGSGADPKTFRELVSDCGHRSMGLPGWSGVEAGVERLNGLICLTVYFLRCRTSSNVASPVGMLVDLVTRILSLTVPSDDQSKEAINPSISREEREGLWNGLPRIHIEALTLLSTMMDRLGQACVPFIQGTLDQLSWLIEAEYWDSGLRQSIYEVLAKLLPLGGQALTKPCVLLLSPVVRGCCEDLLPTLSNATATPHNPRTAQQHKQNNLSHVSTNADAYLGAKTTLQQSSHARGSEAPWSDLLQSAWLLLPLLVSEIPTAHLSASLRDQIDRTAILAQHKDAILASVLNQPPVKRNTKPPSSIFPFLVQGFGGNMEVEGLLRPRMPIARPQTPFQEDQYLGANSDRRRSDSSPSDYEGGDNTSSLDGLRERGIRGQSSSKNRTREPERLPESLGEDISQESHAPKQASGVEENAPNEKDPSDPAPDVSTPREAPDHAELPPAKRARVDSRVASVVEAPPERPVGPTLSMKEDFAQVAVPEDFAQIRQTATGSMRQEFKAPEHVEPTEPVTTSIHQIVPGETSSEFPPAATSAVAPVPAPAPAHPVPEPSALGDGGKEDSDDDEDIPPLVFRSDSEMEDDDGEEGA